MSPKMPFLSLESIEGQLSAVVEETLPKLPYDRAEDCDRFAQAVLNLLETRALSEWPGERDANCAVFVMAKRPREYSKRLGSTSIWHLHENRIPILGKLFVMNRDCQSGEELNLPCKPEYLPDWLTKKGLDEQTIVVAYRNKKGMLVYRNGLQDDPYALNYREHKPQVNFEYLLKELDRFHIQNVLTPGGPVQGVWQEKRSNEYVPGRRPERSIQDAMILWLRGAFQGLVRVQSEIGTNIGRFDVVLLEPNKDGRFVYWVVIEIKIIKAYRNAIVGNVPENVSSAQNAEAIKEGIKQIWAYKKNMNFSEGVLEIYDMRTVNQKKENLMTKSDVKNCLNGFDPQPVWNVRQIFGSASDARNAGFSGI